MYDNLNVLTLIIVLAPLLGAILAGLMSKELGRRGTHTVTILLMFVSLVAAGMVAWLVLFDDVGPYNGVLYTWGAIKGNVTFNIGFLIDHLTAVMMLTVTFVSFLVHVYTVGYMRDDPGYQRFFCYISLFTFSMLMLVTANNFLQLFFGWEAVGLVSYLLIGFWFKKESANYASLKSFLANRVGDFGFILGIGAVLTYFGSIDYAPVFANANAMANTTISIFPGTHWSIITVICILLFVGAMGKSAQVPLHVWLPDSMEGPTPISALIHAATMVTAGVFMVARMSPLFEHSTVALSMVLIIGATGALFTGILALVQFDIKRVIAYSTLSQLGYMMAAAGASAYSAAIFHLVTHACFKALLFLSAGSVIIAMHHEQDMRKMGGLWKYMPITYITFLIGGLALSAIPPFAGFYSKESIIEAVHLSQTPGATYAYYCVLLGAFVTAFYTFRAFFMTFHTKPRMDEHTRSHLKESPLVVTIPLILLAIPSVFIGAIMIKPMLFSQPGLLGNSITVFAQHNVLAIMAKEFQGPIAQVYHSVYTASFWIAVSGIVLAWLFYIVWPTIPAFLEKHFKWLHTVLVKKYGFDDFNDWAFAGGTRRLSKWLLEVIDDKVIDDGMINGSGRSVTWGSRISRRLQTGYLYHYAFAMVLGLLVFLVWMLL